MVLLPVLLGEEVGRIEGIVIEEKKKVTQTTIITILILQLFLNINNTIAEIFKELTPCFFLEGGLNVSHGKS